MTTSTDALPVRSVEAGGLAGLGLAGWLGTMSPPTACAYEGLPGAVQRLARRPRHRTPSGTPRTTAWLADLAADGQRVATRRRKLAAALSFYRYAAAEAVTVTAPRPARRIER